ncbi:MAG: hypothetical protein SOV24_01035 [Muribaculaceae bacterium]|nr:hypothetical protein [Bacteroidales bacterium]MDY2732940.1 hypothetical protein [Muribaculaceae bacterium]
MEGKYNQNSIPEEFLVKSMLMSRYTLKPDTTTSFYFQDGFKILPQRVSLANKDARPAKNTGRNRKNFINNLEGTFKKRPKEETLLTQNGVSRIHTGIYREPQYPLFLGSGTIGTAGKTGGVKGDNGDLVVLYTPDQPNKIETIVVFYFIGMADNKDQVFRFLQSQVEKGVIDLDSLSGGDSQPSLPSSCYNPSVSGGSDVSGDSLFPEL